MEVPVVASNEVGLPEIVRPESGRLVPPGDEAALAAALREGAIAGAALDVFEREPEVDPDLLELDNVVLVPHLGSATVETRTAMAELAAANAIAVVAGERAPTPVYEA
jgi:glyoxylate reductase